MVKKISNRLLGQTSPYLLQHAENPVNWFPWCDEAFDLAVKEDKPIFLSIGYSTCHWCHVMAHESFEDIETADLLNKYFISIKVDKEERPDIDSVYMSVCQAFTGSGGWPLSIFMTPERKPFFAGTYFPKTARFGTIGFKQLLLLVNEKWHSNRSSLLESANDVISALSYSESSPADMNVSLLTRAVTLYKQSFDNQYGGFGQAPKFPAPHNLMFLLQQYVKHGDRNILHMVEYTLKQMYRGGIFDHIGYGFCRYSTDRRFLVPHFEKMLYDNAMLIMIYAKAYEITKDSLYLDVAEKTAFYILTEMQSDTGGFYSAQDADSDGEEGKYYTFTPQETVNVLGENDAKAFNLHYNITEHGNFEGKSIPNLLYTDDNSEEYEALLPKLREFRKLRTKLHTDDKILTTWNALMIAGLCLLYRVSKKLEYLTAAKHALDFIKNNLRIDDTLFVSCRNNIKSEKGFLDEYAAYIYALLAMYDVTLDNELIKEASHMSEKAINDFFDEINGGFFFYGKEHETLIIRPKETYDGAIPSGNSIMTYNLVKLSMLFPNQRTDKVLEKQMRFMAGEAELNPQGYSMYLTALSNYLEPAEMITVVIGNDGVSDLIPYITSDTIVKVLDSPTESYKLKNGYTALYVCKENKCFPPLNKNEYLEKYNNRKKE